MSMIDIAAGRMGGNSNNAEKIRQSIEAEAKLREKISRRDALIEKAKMAADEAERAKLSQEFTKLDTEIRRMQNTGSHSPQGGQIINPKDLGQMMKSIASGMARGMGSMVGNFASWAKTGTGKAIGGIKKPTFLHTIVFVLALWVFISIEILGGELQNSISGTRFSYLMAFMLAMFLVSLAHPGTVSWKQLFIAVGWTLIIPMIFGVAARLPFIEGGITTLLFGIIAPGFLWYFFLSDNTSYLYPIARFALFVTLLILLIGQFSPVFGNLNFQGEDTGFSTRKFVSEMQSSLNRGWQSTFGQITCLLGGNCGFGNWITRLTEPFAYDATTVHKLQNRNLGVYIDRVEMPQRINTENYYASGPLAEVIRFWITAPIPDDIGFELCDVKDTELKGFEGICDGAPIVSCSVKDVPGTSISPQDIDLKRIIASKTLLATCRMEGLPSSLGSKPVNISVKYNFATNTYKFIRAVDLERSYTVEAQRELRDHRDDYIISNGGPVIIQSDESDYIAVARDNDMFEMTFKFRAMLDSRLTKLNEVYVYVPSGSEITGNQNDQYCSFEEQTIDLGGQPQKVFKITAEALSRINERLDANTEVNNEFLLPCRLNVTSKEEFLFPNVLISERTVNIIAKYEVEHIKKGSIDFTGIVVREGSAGAGVVPVALDIRAENVNDFIQKLPEEKQQLGTRITELTKPQNHALLIAIGLQESSLTHYTAGGGVVLGDDGRGIGMFQINYITAQGRTGTRCSPLSDGLSDNEYREKLKELDFNIQCAEIVLENKLSGARGAQKIDCRGTQYSSRYQRSFSYDWRRYSDIKYGIKAYNGLGCEPQFVNSYAEQVEMWLTRINGGTLPQGWTS